MGNGKLLQVLTLLLCLSFGYFTFKNYDDIKELRNENAFLRDTIDSLLCQPATAIKEDIGKTEKKSAAAKPDEKPAPTGVVSFINELVGDAQEEYRAAKKANQNAPKKTVVPILKVKSSYRMEDRYVGYKVYEPQELGNAEGIVKLDITIDKYGDVKSAKLSSASSITDEEVIEACKKAALQTDFNYNYDAPKLQQGTITYTFYR